MIQIDDSGSGSFVGGTCIGLYRPETNDYYFDIIPVEFYNQENFKKKLYLEEVVEIVEEGFRVLKATRDDTIEVCRGYMFERLKDWLNAGGYTWYCTQISGRAQEIIEKNFVIYAESLGLPVQYLKYTGYPFHFHKLLRWVFADYEKRIGLCKVGWKCWQQISKMEVAESEEVMKFSNLSCLKCGNRIKKGSKVKVLKYTSNKENYVYLHKGC